MFYLTILNMNKNNIKNKKNKNIIKKTKIKKIILKKQTNQNI